MVFSEPAYDGHEQVAFYADRETGLRAIIAIHDTTLGPAAGGCRMWPYPSEEAAVTDALRLSAAMTAKNALAGLPLGGGKSVIIGDPHGAVSPDLFRAFGRRVQDLGGRYWTAEDVGVGLERVGHIAETCDYTFGVDGDPSPHTAYGGLMAIEAALEFVFGTASFDHRTVAIQGAGHVGGNLCRLLADRGAALAVADLDETVLAAVAAETGAVPVPPDEIYQVEADVFAPCALGGVINDETIPRLRMPIVAGLANNQLGEPRHGQELTDRGILYAPDFVANSGGMLSAAGPILGVDQESPEAIRARLEHIKVRMGEIFDRAAAEGRAPSAVADAMAREIIEAARG